MLPRHQALTNQPKPPNHCPTAEFVETIQTHTFVQRLKDLSGCRRTKFIHTHTCKTSQIYSKKNKEKKQAPTNRVLKADRKSAKTKKTNINDENTRQGYQHPTSQRVESTRSTPDQRLHSEASIKSMLRSFTRPAL